jgi:hypothetical protein
MAAKLGRIGLATLVLGGLTLGCHRNAVQKKQPPDPLLVTKKPVEGRPHAPEPEASVRAEPPEPPAPAADLRTVSVPPSPPAPVPPVQLGFQALPAHGNPGAGGVREAAGGGRQPPVDGRP